MVSRCDALDALLPQTQCGLCGYGGCRPYAEAMALGSASIDRCPPGGVTTLRALATFLEIDPEPYEADVAASARLPATAVIREAECIGCTKCIQACPVDAIVGAAKFMHSIIPHECTGCGLCLEPCPVDCIDWVNLSDLEAGKTAYEPSLARSRYAAKQVRLLQTEQLQAQHYREKSRLMARVNDEHADKEAKRAYILEAMTRALSVKK